LGSTISQLSSSEQPPRRCSRRVRWTSQSRATLNSLI
jgi:hypothetical protein